jgi:hypothetical protein
MIDWGLLLLLMLMLSPTVTEIDLAHAPSLSSEGQLDTLPLELLGTVAVRLPLTLKGIYVSQITRRRHYHPLS